MLHFFEKGHGHPLLFLHGFCESGEMWRHLADSLASQYRVICPDFPGFGNSPLSQPIQRIEEVAEQLEDWVQALQIKNPIVMGHSLGGYVALALLERMGERIKAIGLLHSTAFADDQEKIEIRNRTLTFLKKHGAAKFVSLPLCLCYSLNTAELSWPKPWNKPLKMASAPASRVYWPIR